MQTASWDEIEQDLKLGVFLITVGAQSLVGDRSEVAASFGKAALGVAFDTKQPAISQADELEDLLPFNVSGTHFWQVSKMCFDFVHDRTPLDKLDVGDFQADTLNWMTYFRSAVPRDAYGTSLGNYSDRFHERHDRGDEFPVPHLHLAAVAKANLVEFLQAFPGELDHGSGFAPFEIAALAGMTIASVRNFVGPGGNKPIRSMPKDSWGTVYGHPLDTLDWLAGRRKFDAGPLSKDWLYEAADRVDTPERVGAMLGIYAWINRITTETLAERSGLPVEVARNWTRGELGFPEDAAALADAAGIDPDFYCEIVARCGDTPRLR